MASTRLVSAIRQFSTSAARKALVQAPIQVFGIEGRYAHAIYSAASKEKKLDAVEKELKGIQTVLNSDVRISEFLANPSIKRQEKIDVLSDILKLQKASNLTSNLLAALAENGRINRIDSIFGAFSKIMSAHRGEVICSVTTAKALDNAQQKDLKAALQAFLKPNESLMLDMIVDPTIIGGMVVNIGDKFIDMSMSTKIKTYTALIKQAV